jgi:hypothetical protein
MRATAARQRRSARSPECRRRRIDYGCALLLGRPSLPFRSVSRDLS